MGITGSRAGTTFKVPVGPGRVSAPECVQDTLNGCRFRPKGDDMGTRAEQYPGSPHGAPSSNEELVTLKCGPLTAVYGGQAQLVGISQKPSKSRKHVDDRASRKQDQTGVFGLKL